MSFYVNLCFSGPMCKNLERIFFDTTSTKFITVKWPRDQCRSFADLISSFNSKLEWLVNDNKFCIICGVDLMAVHNCSMRL
jgi:hypothetical protein